MNLSGGTVENGNRINKMTYTGGNYSGSYSGTYQGTTGKTGSIGTLTLAGNSASNTGNWGTVNNLVFDGNGNGILSIAGFADGADLGFNGVKATTSVDLANAGISLDLSSILTDANDLFGTYGDGSSYTFSLASLFGTENVSWADLDYFDIVWADGVTENIYGNNKWSAGWTLGDYGVTGSSSNVPEPATLVMLGLGLAGLGLARRRRK